MIVHQDFNIDAIKPKFYLSLNETIFDHNINASQSLICEVVFMKLAKSLGFLCCLTFARYHLPNLSLASISLWFTGNFEENEPGGVNDSTLGESEEVEESMIHNERWQQRVKTFEVLNSFLNSSFICSLMDISMG